LGARHKREKILQLATESAAARVKGGIARRTARSPDTMSQPKEMQMIRLALMTTTVALGLAALQPAQAQGFGPRGDRPDFATLDADGDGAVSPAEMQAYRDDRMAERFATIDADGDGAVSLDEMQNAPAARFAARMLDRFDTDGDGAISGAELEAVAALGRGPAFGRIDADSDGTISEDEFAGMHRGMRGDMGERGFGPRHGEGRGGWRD
jgi:Ca2+-binding EF-hand superfamily protein